MKRSFPWGLLAVLAIIGIAPASAVAATTIDVNSTTDAPLESGATTCTSTDAGKDCTLRAAVELANADSKAASGEAVTVEVPTGTYTETLSDLVVESGASVAIHGAGIGNTIIDGGGTNTVLSVQNAGVLNVTGVTIRHGHSDAGGGIFLFDGASLSVDSSAIEGNEAGEVGGGIFAEYVSTVTISKSFITGNVAGGEHSEGGYGAGLFVEAFSSVVIEQSTIDGNDARYSGGGIYLETASDFCDGAVGQSSRRRPHGDAAALEEPSYGLTIKQSTIEGNRAEGGVGGGLDTEHYECEDDETAGHPAAHASAHHSWAHRAHPSPSAVRSALRSLRPASISESPSELTIEQSTIAKNKAEASDEGISGLGGGIFEGETFIEDPIINSTIAENTATFDGGGIETEGVEELISDTVFGNTVEEEDLDTARRDAHPDIVVEEDGPGSNLAAAFEPGAAIFLRDTIVAEPKGSEAENCEGSIGSLIEGAGYNLDYPSDSLEESSTDTCGMSEGEKDLVGVEPQLSPEGLHGNGGPTQTIALLSTSPAIGFVPVAENCENTEDGPGLLDQRGEHRPGIAGKGCDIGAYEYQEPPAKKEETKEKEPTPPAKEPTPTPETPKTTTTPTPPAAGVSPFKVQAPQMCTSKRDIKIHIQNVKQFGIVSAVVSIDGKHKRTLKGEQLSTAIDLVGLPKGTFTIEIVAYTRGGHTLHGKRVYHTCHTKLPGRSYIPL